MQAMSDNNYYEVLGVKPGADGTAVHRSYWQLARKYQALAPADPRAAQMLDDLNEAYGVLGTPALREQYDAGLGQAASVHGRRSERSPRRLDVARVLPWRRKDDIQPGPSDITGAPSRPATRTAPPAAPRRARGSHVDDLRSSTASIVGRWRKTAAPDVLRTKDPDTTLVDIFQSERAIEEPEEPLTAVLDVLRGSHEPASTR
jgi:curved DNA-binding protein CbpA